MTAASRQLDAFRGRLFTSAWVLYAGFYICRKNLAMTMDSGASTRSGFLAAELACFGAAYAATQFLGGELADRFSARSTALAGAAISILCTLSLAWAPASVVLLLQVGNGLGQGFGWPALLKLIGAWFADGERDRVLGWWSTSYILGGFLATSLTARLIARNHPAPHAGWDSTFAISSAVLLVAAVYFARQTADLPPQPNLSTAHGDDGKAWGPFLRNPNVRMIAAMYFFLKMTRYTLLFWLPHYLISSAGYTVEAAEHAASCFEIAGVAGPIATGYIVARWFNDRPVNLGAGMLYTLAFFCLLHPLLAGSGWLGMAVSISIMGALIHGADLLMSGMAVLRLTEPPQHGRAVGFINGIGSIGQAISPLLATLYVAHFGWSTLFDLFVCFALVSGMICTVGSHLQTCRAQESSDDALPRAKRLRGLPSSTFMRKSIPENTSRTG